MLSASRFNRRLHRIAELFFLTLFLRLGETWKKFNKKSVYVIDPVPAYMTYFQVNIRKIVEPTGSLIERLLPKSIHVNTAKGFEIKVALFVLACSLTFLW
jgi:hypothetical protein